MAIDRTNFNAIVDSNGTPGHGSVWDKAAIAAVLLDPIDAAIVAGAGGATVQTTTSTGTVNNFAATAARHLMLRCNNASLLTLTGLSAGSDGDVIDVISVGAGQVDLSPQAGGSTAANRLINFAPTGSTSLAAGSGAASYIYDGTTARWRLTDHTQGAWIAVPFVAGNFTAGSGSWTLASGDQIVFKYVLHGRTLTVLFDLNNTTVTATPADLNIAIPGGHASASNAFFIAGGAVNNGGTREVFFAVPAASSIICRRAAATTWSTATDTTNVAATVSFEVS